MSRRRGALCGPGLSLGLRGVTFLEGQGSQPKATPQGGSGQGAGAG